MGKRQSEDGETATGSAKKSSHSPSPPPSADAGQQAQSRQNSKAARASKNNVMTSNTEVANSKAEGRENASPMDVETDDQCWICLDDKKPCDALVQPCKCPRKVHARCMARWQLQQAGRAEETHCRFCKSTLQDWKHALTPDVLKPEVEKVQPIMVVYFEGEIHRIPVRQGNEGLKEFTARIRELFKLPPEVDISLTFGCKEPMSGHHLKLEGMGAFDAAVHCASVAAAERQHKQAGRQARRAAGIASQESSDDGEDTTDLLQSTLGGPIQRPPAVRRYGNPTPQAPATPTQPPARPREQTTPNTPPVPTRQNNRRNGPRPETGRRDIPSSMRNLIDSLNPNAPARDRNQAPATVRQQERPPAPVGWPTGLSSLLNNDGTTNPPNTGFSRLNPTAPPFNPAPGTPVASSPWQQMAGPAPAAATSSTGSSPSPLAAANAGPTPAEAFGAGATSGAGAAPSTQPRRVRRTSSRNQRAATAAAPAQGAAAASAADMDVDNSVATGAAAASATPPGSTGGAAPGASNGSAAQPGKLNYDNLPPNPISRNKLTQVLSFFGIRPPPQGFTLGSNVTMDP